MFWSVTFSLKYLKTQKNVCCKIPQPVEDVFDLLVLSELQLKTQRYSSCNDGKWEAFQLWHLSFIYRPKETGRNTSVKIRSVHRQTLLMCECTRAVRFCVFMPRFCQVKLLSSNLLCFSVGVSHGWVILSLPIFPSSASMLSWHSFPNSCPVSFSHLSLSHIQESTFSPKCQKCSVRRIRYVPYESVFLLLSN